MPLCASSRGKPHCFIPWASPVPIDEIKRMALEMFEWDRQRAHGESMKLPSLDPDRWRLRELGYGLSVQEYVLELVPDVD
jgi:hypothetical protein